MTPQERDKDVVRMPENFDIPVHFRQIELNELWIIIQSNFGLHIKDYINFYSSLSCCLKNIIKSWRSIVKVAGPLQQKVWS